MKTKQDFLDQIAASISGYPTVAQLYQAGDPILLSMLEAMASQLSMISAEIDVAAMEPWTKARDVTVLADAAIKGVLPFGRPARVKVLVENVSSSPVQVSAGRKLLDTQGREYVVDQGATVAPGGSGFIYAVQKQERSFTHTVTVSQPFYRINVPAAEGGRHIVEIRVSGDAQYKFIPEFVNVAVGERTFHIESDEQRVINIQFGADGIAGYQPGAGELMTVTVVETNGSVTLSPGSKYAFEYSYSAFERGVQLKHDSLVSPGAAPLDIATLREICSYPSIYDQSAVYRGNFDFLVRRQLSPFKFLSVWNEQIEEAVRGPSVDNINRLFVAAESDGVDQTSLRADISRVIRGADDSYRITFVDVDHSPIPVNIAAAVPAIYDFAVVRQQIIDVVLAEYGPNSTFAKRGMSRVLYKRLYDLLTKKIQALQGSGSDVQITITDSGTILPEQYRYVSLASLTVNVTQYQYEA